MNMTQKPASCIQIDPAVRSDLYKLLSLGFRYPAPVVFKTFQNGEFLDELWNNISSLPHLNDLMIEQASLSRKVKNDLNGITFADFEIKFVQTFDVGAPLPPCPLYEGMYRSEPRTAIMLEVSEFYRHFGLLMSQKEGKREMPDHLSAELEFLHFLTFKEAHAIRDNDMEVLQVCLLAQKDFLERHLMQWVPKFSGKLQSLASVPFYLQLAQITSIFLTCELELVNSSIRVLF